MRNLRLLNIDNVHLPQGLSFLSSELRVMNWLGYPLKFMPINFNPNKLVKLIMPRNHIKQLWEGNWVRTLLLRNKFFFFVKIMFIIVEFSIWLFFNANRV